MGEKRKDYWRRFVNTVRGWWGSVSGFFKAHFWWVYSVYVIILLVVAGYLASRYWEDLSENAGHARNFILVVAALIGLPLAIWRSAVADRQSKTAQQQSETAQRQSETAQRGLLNERYQKGAEMLGSKVLSVRLGGIYALELLAKEHAEDYHVQIVKLFCAFVLNPPRDEHDNDAQSGTPKEKNPKIREDVQAIMTALGQRNEKQQKVEQQEIGKREKNIEPMLIKTYVVLNGADLSGARLRDADLSGAVLDRVDLSRTLLSGADLSAARLDSAKLSGARLDSAKLSGAVFADADLSRAVFAGADLSDALLHGAKLSSAVLDRVDLSRTLLSGADLSGARLWYAKLSSARLWYANLSGARLDDANLSGADIRGVRGLTQSQLNQAIADPNNPPKLGNAKDSETGEPLIWRGKAPPSSSS